MLKRSQVVTGLILIILLLDQLLKIYIKTNFHYGEEIKMLGLNWARLHFVENEGMAFGFSFGGEYGKLALSLFRIIVVTFLGYYLAQLIRSKVALGFAVSVGLIFAGAMGNIIDSSFYGLIFSESPYHGGIAEMFPEGGGYASFLHGKVVDMFYFPILTGRFPEWMPFWSGESFTFFRPVFNVADSAITVGVLSIILFHREYLKAEENPKSEDTSSPDPGPEENTVITDISNT